MGADGEARTLYDVAHNIVKIETHNIHVGHQCVLIERVQTRPLLLSGQS